MVDDKLFERITCDPMVIVGKLVFKGTRLTVDYVLNLLAHGATVDETLDEYADLKRKGILACLLHCVEVAGGWS